jgi:hypothetical protein
VEKAAGLLLEQVFIAWQAQVAQAVAVVVTAQLVQVLAVIPRPLLHLKEITAEMVWEALTTLAVAVVVLTLLELMETAQFVVLEVQEQHHL